MATKKQSTTTDSTAPENQQIPVPVVAKGTKKTGTTKKTPAAKTTETAAAPAAPAATPAKTAAPAKKKAAAPKAETSAQSTALTKVYGQIQASEGKYFIENGSVPEGRLQLELPKSADKLADRIPSYSGQFVTILGEFAKKKNTFVLSNITSHDEIGRRAFELSHENPSAVEDNWFKAENELLQA